MNTKIYLIHPVPFFKKICFFSPIFNASPSLSPSLMSRCKGFLTDLLSSIPHPPNLFSTLHPELYFLKNTLMHSTFLFKALLLTPLSPLLPSTPYIKNKIQIP